MIEALFGRRTTAKRGLAGNLSPRSTGEDLFSCNAARAGCHRYLEGRSGRFRYPSAGLVGIVQSARRLDPRNTGALLRLRVCCSQPPSCFLSVSTAPF